MSWPWFHHTLIHFPIGLAFLAPLLHLAFAWRRPQPLWQMHMVFIAWVAALSALAAATTGLLSAPHLLADNFDPAIIERHRNVALAASVVLMASAATATWAHRTASVPIGRVGVALSVIGLAVVCAAGHFGGEMLHPGIEPFSTKHTHDMAGMPMDPGAHDDEDEHDHGAHPHGVPAPGASIDDGVKAVPPEAATPRPPPTSTLPSSAPPPKPSTSSMPSMLGLPGSVVPPAPSAPKPQSSAMPPMPGM